MEFLAVIPARYDSTRLPGKPLIEFQNKPMIQWVYERAATVYDKLIVATDDQRIFDAVSNFGGHVQMTSKRHPDGTSRVFEVYETFDEPVDYVINIQGDEPLLDIQMLKDLNASIAHSNSADVVTLSQKVNSAEELMRDSDVFIVKNVFQDAMYFSRTVIPAQRDVPKADWHLHHTYLKHIGLYAYRADVFSKLVRIESSSYENLEKLEQLKWLEHGFRIHLGTTEGKCASVDTAEDVARIHALLQTKKID